MAGNPRGIKRRRGMHMAGTMTECVKDVTNSDDRVTIKVINESIFVSTPMDYLQNTQVNVLLAEDDADDRYFFQEALGELSIGTNLKMVPDGERLMSYLVQNYNQLPDILFLDINMPRKNGLECLFEIRLNEKLSRIPVVICSTAHEKDIADMLSQTGVYYYIHKCSYPDFKKYILQTLTLLGNAPKQHPPAGTELYH
jgi:CheY-like chemotaxis protein